MSSPPPAPHSPAPGRSVLRTVLTREALVRLGLGWAAVAALSLFDSHLGEHPASPVIALLLAAIVAVIVAAAGGVVRQAEALAHRLGDPYGTLVLTLSIVVIEVVLIAAVMLGPGEHATIARDSVMAVSMIIMDLALGLCLLVGGLKHGSLRMNRAGTGSYLVLLVALGTLAFALPAVLDGDGAYSPDQAIVVAALTVAVYGFFLWRQTGAQAAEFQEVRQSRDIRQSRDVQELREVAAESVASPADRRGAQPPSADGSPSLHETLTAHRAELLLRTGALIATVLPIVLLSHHMAGLLDIGLARLGAPVALGGVLIAMIVFTPESITAVRAAAAGEIQRVVNLCHGALVSTYALTIPTVLVLGLLTGTEVVLAESPANLLLLGATLAVSAISAAAPRVTAVHGAVHLLLFGIYALVLLS